MGIKSRGRVLTVQQAVAPTIVHLDAFGLVGPSVVEEPVGGEVVAVGIGLARHVTHLKGPLVHRRHLVIA